jgi:hypothetical protein|tara:strand:+ start:5476 stop:5907 length:432 start_codon:yes stop_codon:yes gene_type:complete
MEWGEPPVLPSVVLPEPPNLPRPILDIPRADLPSYKPLVVPPSDLRPPPGIKSDPKDEPPKSKVPVVTPPPIQLPEVQTFEVPGTDIEVPVPSGEILVTAATTAVVSVAATLSATALFKYLVTLLKPVFKQAWSKITTKKVSS